MAGLVLPQCLLGGEAQLLAFAAASPELAGRCFFAPLPEMFSGDLGLEGAWRGLGVAAPDVRRVVHFRFGSTRMARVLKGARNGAVVAERHGAGPLTSSHHPFASGLVLPAAMRRVFVYGPEETRPSAFGGAVLGATRLPPWCVDADLAGVAGSEDEEDGGLDVVAFGDFRSGQWAAGPLRGRARAAIRELRSGVRVVLLPWNMDHPGSIVPELLARLARLQDPAAPRVRVLVMPFNYLGQTGIIRRLVGQVRDAAGGDERMLGHVFLGRLSRLQALAQLVRLAPVAWVDGNDPEQAWTRARLAACGLRPVLLGSPGEGERGDVPHLPCEETLSIETETRWGTLTFPVRLPSLRAMGALLAMGDSERGELGRRPRGRGKLA